MAYTHARTPVANGGVSLYLRPWSRSAAVVVLVLLSSAIDLSGKELAFRSPRDLLAGEPAAFMELLEAARPAPVSMEDMGAILRALPRKARLPSSEPRRTRKWMRCVSYSSRLSATGTKSR
jgi:hypothetical protein